VSRTRHRPSASSCWTGALFAIGSTCFALGSVPVYFDAVSASTAAWTFFIGSIFFTSAAVLQHRSAPSDRPGETRPDGGSVVRATLSALSRPTARRAAAVQLVGTVFFNLSTFAATRDAMSTQQERRLVWAPDVFGSVCFLVASAAGWSLVRADRPRAAWSATTIGAVNLAGSIAFGAAALGARLLRTDGETANIELVNLGTFAGAVCFFVGAALLPVDDARSPVSP
jgi:hypothetical protein